MGFTNCYIGLTSEHLSNAISKAMVNLGLSMDNRRRYRYDGVGSIAGTEKCVTSRMSWRNPNAIYIHSYSHILNFCVMKCIKIV